MLTCIEVHTAVSTHYTTQRLIEAHRHTDQSPMYRRTDKITQTWSHCCTNTLTRRDTLIHQIDRQTHISAWNTCTHTRTPHAHVHSNKPQHHPSFPAAVAHALLPTPPRGRRCPRGNRGLRSLLKPCWLPRDINSSLAAAGSSKLSAGAGPAPGTDTSALVGRTERASCPLSTLRLPPRLLPAASPQAVQVRGAGEARAWQSGCQGPARRGVDCRSTDSGHWLKPGYAPYLGSSAARLLRAPWGWASQSSLDR